jgi:hypothetical protein
LIICQLPYPLSYESLDEKYIFCQPWANFRAQEGDGSVSFL